MRGIGFSMKWMLIGLALVAVGLAALFNASMVWVGVIGLITTLFLLTAVVASVYSRGRRRAFWVGCCVFAWGYLFIADNPLADNVRHPTLLTHVALDTLHEAIAQEEALGPYAADADVDDDDDEYRRRQEWAAFRSSFRRIGHCLFAWLFALVGGFLARYFYLAQEQKAASPGDTCSP